MQRTYTPSAHHPTRACRSAVWAALLLIALSAAGVDAQCYLEDSNADCSVCWFTTYGSADDKTGTTKMSACPSDISVSWETPLPAEMTEYQTYEAKYKIHVADMNKYQIVPKLHKDSGKLNDVPHANIHSCIASRGACTPFVANTPGLATHTPAVVGNVAADGTETFLSEVKLTREQYTIIAHVRFFTPNADPALPPTKIDAAIGVSREVLKEVVEVSADSYISTAVMGALIFIVIGGIWYGFRKGVIDIDAVLEAIYSDEVTLPIDIVSGLGDVTAFTVSVFTIILYDPATVQVVPAAILFLAFAWVGSIYNAYHDMRQMWSIHMLKNHRAKFMQKLTSQLVQKTVKQARRLSSEMTDSPNGIQRRVSLAGEIVDNDKSNTMLERHLNQHIIDEAQEEHKFNVMLDLEVASREIRRKRGDVVTIVTESIPITAIQTYVLLNAESVSPITVITLIFAAVVLGAKASGLGMYKTARIKKEQCEVRFHDTFDVVLPDTGSARGKGDLEAGNNRVVPEAGNNRVVPIIIGGNASSSAEKNQLSPPPPVYVSSVQSVQAPAEGPAVAAAVPLE